MFTLSRRFAMVLIALVLPLSAQAVPERVGDFALLDSAGEFHQLSRYLHRKAVVMMSYDADCQSMDDMVVRLRELQSRFEDQGVTFLLLDSMDTPRPEMAGHDLGLPVLEDDGQLVSETLDITRAGEVLVLEPLRLSLFYRGPAGRELGQVIEQALAGTVSDTIKGDLDGCEIAYPVRDQHAAKVPDYATEVAPIVIEKCAECHREGGAGPFAIDSHIMLMGWSPMIREVVLNRRMPPTQVDPYVSHTKNARFVTPEQMQTLVHWIDAGGPPSASGADPLADVEFPDQKTWILGEPDYIVEVPDTAIAAVGIMDYVYQDVALPFTEDKWIKAVQYVAGDPSVLHHLVTYVTAPDEDFWGPERSETTATRSFVESFAPGRPVMTQYPAGTGVHIPAGHQLSMQFHFVTNGRATIDQTRIGLYFHDEPPDHERLTQVVGARFTIPPNDPNYEMHSQHVFDTDVLITGLRARMHYRGKKMKFAVENPDGSLREILSVPAYNYGWQPHYQLNEPVLVPAGVRVHVIGAFDNSESNPLNPDPSKEVPFGVDSWDEMFTGYFTYHTM